MSTDPPRHVVLVGPMGAGKTTVGRICARRLGRPFVDTDDVVVANAGMSVAEIFATEGEAGFRERERAAVAEVAASPRPLVVACGGGVPLDAVNRRRLRDRGIVVLLDAVPEVLADRLAGTDDRPLLGTDARATLTRLRELRRDAYSEVSDVVVDTAGRSVDDVADAVLDAVEVLTADEEAAR